MAATTQKEAPLSAEEVRSLANLVSDSLDDLDRLDDNGLLRHAAWRAIGDLHRKGGGVALELCRSWLSGSPPQRRAAARILGQLGYSEQPFFEERFSVLADMLASELQGGPAPAVLNDICVAFGHLRNARAIPLVLPLAAHESSDVRFGVVMALSGYTDADAIAGLISLSRDEDPDVRDWATFGLGSLTDADTPELREALMARLRDPDGDTDQEAIFGLARRRELRVVPRIFEALEAGALSAPLFEAVTCLASPEFCPALLAIASDWLVFHVDEQRIDLTNYWREAVEACGCATN